MPQEQQTPPFRVRWNEVTWYSKLGAIIVFLGVIPALSFYFGAQYQAIQDTLLSAKVAVLPSPPNYQITPVAGKELPSHFTCKDDKSISNIKYGDDESVTLSLSDGRTLKLAQEFDSRSIFRSDDLSIVFDNGVEGDTSHISEDGKLTFSDCK